VKCAQRRVRDGQMPNVELGAFLREKALGHKCAPM